MTTGEYSTAEMQSSGQRPEWWNNVAQKLSLRKYHVTATDRQPFQCFKEFNFGAGESSQQLRALGALAEGTCMVT